MTDDTWTSRAIRDRLKANQSKGLGSSAQVFFDPQVPNADLGSAAETAIRKAASRLGRAADVEVGRVRPLAKSAAVSGDPDVIAEMLQEPSVKAILPSALDDVHPKPLNVKRVE